MARGVGEVAFARSLPDTVVAAGGLVTQLGDAWFLFLAIAAVYWRARTGDGLTATPLRDCLFLLALLVGSYALVTVLKGAFALPRPPGARTAVVPGWLPPAFGPVYDLLVTGDGYGFPSGHATTATAVYGGGAVRLSTGSRRLRSLVAGTLVALVTLSRVVIGVHYLVDVVAGVALGFAFLVALSRAAGDSPARALGVTVVLALLAAAVAPAVESVLGLAAAAGALGLWLRSDTL